MPQQQRRRSRRQVGPVSASRFINYSCPVRILEPLNEARFALRERSRNAIISRAIETYLRAHGISVPTA